MHGCDFWVVARYPSLPAHLLRTSPARSLLLKTLVRAAVPPGPPCTPFAPQEAKESAALAKATISKTTQRLSDKVGQMEALTNKYQQAGRWGGVGQLPARRNGEGQGRGGVWAGACCLDLYGAVRDLHCQAAQPLGRGSSEQPATCS